MILMHCVVIELAHHIPVWNLQFGKQHMPIAFKTSWTGAVVAGRFARPAPNKPECVASKVRLGLKLEELIIRFAGLQGCVYNGFMGQLLITLITHRRMPAQLRHPARAMQRGPAPVHFLEEEVCIVIMYP